MPSVFSVLIAYVLSHFRSRASLRLENMALRHQLAVYQHTVKRPKLRPSVASFGRGFRACGRAGNRRWRSFSPELCWWGKRSDFETTGEI
jgi:hypothetical protein